MKNASVAFISVALLWGLGGCLYQGDDQLRGFDSEVYP